MGGFLAIRPRTIIDPVGFLSVNGTTLSKYNSDLISNVILEFPPEYQKTAYMDLQTIVKVNDFVYVVSSKNSTNTLRINVSYPKSSLTALDWEYKYKNRKYIAFNGSMFAVGAYLNPFHDSQKYFRSDVHVYHLVAQTRRKLPNTTFLRYGHSLVIFKGLVCAV